jgi:hypothetical protein
MRAREWLTRERGSQHDVSRCKTLRIRGRRERDMGCHVNVT